MIPRIVIGILVIASAAAIFVLPKTNLNVHVQATSQDKTLGVSTKTNEPSPKRVASYQDPPQLTARSAIIIDATSGDSLFEKEPDLHHLPASTTKLLTALVALEKCTAQTQIQVQNVQKEGTKMGLSTGDVVTVETLLYGMLIKSGNDAAYALAENCTSTYNDFINRMNEKAQELGMANSHFTNPAGFDSDFQYSTAHDLAQMGKVAVANPIIAKIVTTKSTVVTDTSGKKTYYLENVNKLLGIVNGIEGVKTGQTEGAGEILITKTTRDTNSIITVVLGSTDRFSESRELIEWAFKNYQWTKE